MKMMMAVISKHSGEKVLEKLVSEGYMATFNETRGGMLRQSQLSIFLGVQDEDVANVLAMIKAHCKLQKTIHKVSNDEAEPALVPETGRFQLGGAVVFVWQLDQIEKY